MNKLDLFVIVTGLLVTLGLFQFQCVIEYNEPNHPSSLTMLQKHVTFFQGKNYDSDYICYGDFVTRLEQLGIGYERYVIGAVIMKLGGDKTNTNEQPWWKILGPMCIYKPNVAMMLHPPADTGIYLPDGSIANYTTIFKSMCQVSHGVEYITKERMLEFIVKRNGGKELTMTREGEIIILYKVLAYFTQLGTRFSPHMLEEDVEAFYKGELFYNLLGEVPPWNYN